MKATLDIRSIKSVGLIALCLCSYVSGQCQFRYGRLIDERSGISDVRVRVIEKGPNGFLWFGTYQGLNRFDGAQFVQYLHDPEDPTSILNDQINAIVVDSGRLWIGGPYGISALDLSTYQFDNIQFDCDSILTRINLQQQIPPDISYMHLDGNVLWITTRNCGLIKFNIPDRDFSRISFAGHSADVPGIVAASELDLLLGFTIDYSMDSIYWIGTNAGLIRFNHVTGTHRLYYQHSDNLVEQDALNICRRTFYHDDKKIYSLTWSEGIQVFDPATETFSALSFPENADPDLQYRVTDAWHHDAHNIWIRTIKGLYDYSTTFQGITAFYPNEEKDARYLPVHFNDESNRRWFATTKGVLSYDPLFEQFFVFSYKDLNVPDWYGFARKIVQHPDATVFTVLGQGVDALYHFSHRGNRWFKTAIPGHSSELNAGFNGVDMAVHDKYDWIFTGSDGVYAFDHKNFVVRKVDLGIDLSRPVFADLEWDKQDQLWIGTRYEGVILWNPQTKQSTRLAAEIYGEGYSHETLTASNLMCDSRGNMWGTTSTGHFVHDALADRFYVFSPATSINKTINNIAHFAEDSTGNVWVISHNGMLAKGEVAHPERGLELQCSIFQNEVRPSYVEGILFGEDKNLYILCESALVRLDTNLNIYEFSFDYTPFLGDFYSFEFLSETNLAIGLRNSFAIIHTEGVKRNLELPLPYLTQITVNEKPLGGNLVNAPQTLQLKHNENFISFSFSAIGYTLSEHNEFRYRLNGFDPGWIEAGSRRFANYTNIPSGDYAFELQVVNNEGLWNHHIYTVPMTIARPWWATWWFRITAFLLAAAIVIGAYRYRVQQIRNEEKLKADFERRIGDVELSALKAQMNPHFIFNCLNSIENYIIKNESVKAAEYINDFARLIRLILQNSRSQYIPLRDEIEALDLYLQMESLRFDNKFDYRIRVSNELENAEADIPPMLIQPFVENAIWHGLIPKNAPGSLVIDLSRQNGSLRCIIEDNGIGRQKSSEVNASMHKRGKKSMGMLITKNRIDVFNELYQTEATVDILDLKDDAGNALGTRVELSIPIE